MTGLLGPLASPSRPALRVGQPAPAAPRARATRRPPTRLTAIGLVAAREAAQRWHSSTFWAASGLMLLMLIAGVLTSRAAPDVALAQTGSLAGLSQQSLVLMGATALLLLVVLVTLGFVTAESIGSDRAAGTAQTVLPAIGGAWLVAGKVLGQWAVATGQVLFLLVTGLIALAATGQAGWLADERLLRVLGWSLALWLASLAVVAALVGRVAAGVRGGGEVAFGVLVATLWGVAPVVVFLTVPPKSLIWDVMCYLPGGSAVLMPKGLLGGAIEAPHVLLAILLSVAAAGLLLLSSHGALERSVRPRLVHRGVEGWQDGG